ncbi:MAG: hypothetical protein ACLT76_03745 [Clostridium fessum]
MARAMMRIRGTYALAVMFKDYPEEIFVARQDNPMIIGVGEGGILYRVQMFRPCFHIPAGYTISATRSWDAYAKGEVTFYNIDQGRDSERTCDD